MTGQTGEHAGRHAAGYGPPTPGLHEDPEVWAPRLLRILDRQHGLYERLEVLSRRQSDAIREDRTDGLLEVLGQRQTLIDELAGLNEEIAPFVQRWEQLSLALPERHRAGLRARFEAVAALVDQISARDEADRRTLESKRSEIEGMLRDVPQARGALAAYVRGAGPGAGATGAAVFQDRRG